MKAGQRLTSSNLIVLMLKHCNDSTIKYLPTKIWSQCYCYWGRFRSVGTHRNQALTRTHYMNETYNKFSFDEQNLFIR